MPDTTVWQKNFRAGEITEALHGDFESEAYKSGLRLSKNWVISKSGQPARKSGWLYGATVKNPTHTGTTLIPFTFAGSLGYVLEFGEFYIRVYAGTTQLFQGNARLSAAVAEIVTTYDRSQVPNIRWAQVGDVITLVHPSHPPRELRRVSAAVWTLTTITFAATDPFAAFSFNKPYGSASSIVNQAAYSNAVDYVPGQYVKNGNSTWIAIQANGPSTTVQTPGSAAGYWQPALDAAHAAKPWNYRISALYVDYLGIVRESRSTTATLIAIAGACVMLDRPFYFTWSLTATPGTPYHIIGYKIYKGIDATVTGYIATTTSPAFTDEGVQPDYSHRPREFTDPFKIVDDDTSTTTYSYPRAVTFHDGRRVFGGTTVKADAVFGSALDAPDNYDQPFPTREDAAYEWRLQAETRQEIRALVSLNNLMALTDRAEWAVRGDDRGRQVSPIAVDRKRQSAWGSSEVAPLLLGEEILYAQPTDDAVRSLYYDARYGKYVGGDVSLRSAHLLEGFGINAWAYARNPNRLMWAACGAAGAYSRLVSATYDREYEINAWAQHETGVGFLGVGDFVESICSVAAGGSDVVYAVVNRVISGTRGAVDEVSTRTIEYMVSFDFIQDAPVDPTTNALLPLTINQKLMFYLDCAELSDSTNADATTVRLDNQTGWAVDDEMDLTLSGTGGGVFPTGFAVGVVGNYLILNPDTAAIALEIIGYTSATKVRVRALNPVAAYYQANATAAWGYAQRVFTHSVLRDVPLESGEFDGARGLTALADGSAIGKVWDESDAEYAGQKPSWNPLTGALTLQTPAVVCLFGLSYNSDVELLEVPEALPGLRGCLKTVKRIFFQMARSRGVWVGEDFDNLTEGGVRTVEDSYDTAPLRSELEVANITSSPNRHGRACVRVFDPLPCMLLAVAREIEYDVGS